VTLAAVGRYPAHCLLAALCAGIAAANLARGTWLLPAGVAVAFAAVGAGAEGRHRLVFAALALAAPIVLTRASAHLLQRGVLLARGRALDALTHREARQTLQAAGVRLIHFGDL
jgi:hypothetical protein